jgi:molecular chaperone DnaK (HSP70)
LILIRPIDLVAASPRTEMSQRVLFVDAINMLRFDRDTSIPTAISYSDGAVPAIGYHALSRAQGTDSLTEEFKIALGEIKPGSAATSRRRVITGDGKSRSAYEITNDFFESLHAQVESGLHQQGLKQASQALISEPLKFFDAESDDWLANYRGNLKRILARYFENVDFMPEPFAVYQYYRYGLKHPLVTDTKKIFALVIDFGGGTFDVSIVETTKTGDISQKGRHAKPIAAQSTSFGGYAINRLIAEYLLNRQELTAAEKEAIHKCLKNYERCRVGDLDIGELNQRNQRFIRWYGQFLSQIEEMKIELSRSISDWRLPPSLAEKCSVQMPDDPFNDVPQMLTVWFSAQELRDIYINQIWPKHLKRTVTSTLKIATNEIGRDRVHVVLLSGGSSNLRWLESLLTRDYGDDLQNADIVSLPESYQEVVAKGLAIECARRGYDEDTEFSDVTYNPLYLVLDPDGKGEERVLFRLIDSSIDVDQPSLPAELLSSASRIGDEESNLRWKTTLRHPPRHRLGYYFMKDPDDVGNLDARYNFVETEAITPRGTTFGSQLKVDLSIRPDGTCEPKFIYRTGKKDKIIHAARGLPFYLDVVSAEGSPRKSAYIGIDFGTSTSAVSYIDWSHVQLIQKRESEPQWLKLHDLLDLPSPVAVPVKRLLAAPDKNQVLISLEAIESIMSFIVCLMWAEMSSQRSEKKVKVYPQSFKRSAGNLKARLVDLKKSRSAPGLGQLLRDRIKLIADDDLDEAVNQLDKEKHQKQTAGQFDPRPIIETLANALGAAFKEFKFGFFEGVKKEGFGDVHKGLFRVAHGSQPFHESLSYEGAHSFSDQEAFIINQNQGYAISLTPVMFWEHDSRRGSNICQCFIYDGISRAKEVEYKHCDEFDTKIIGEGSLKKYLLSVVEEHVPARRYDGLTFGATR